MSPSREELLQPSLTADDPPSAAPYSVQTTFLSGFFGGPLAAIAIMAINSLRLRRGARDLPIWAVILGAVACFAWLLHRTDTGAGMHQWLDGQLGENAVRYVYRAIGLLIVGMGYLLHRQQQRNTDLLSIERPNGWIAGIACIVGGVVLQIVLLAALAR